MQRPVLIFLAPAIALILTTLHPAQAQITHYRLKTADSLFQAKRYTQSLEHYEEILRQNEYTPAMLLKMAYINEGLDRIGPAMYYLNLYYVATHDNSVVSKMDELAEKFNLEGYETTDADRFWNFYLDNHIYISLAIAAVLLLIVSFMYHIRMRLHARPVGSAITVMALTILLAVHQHYGTVGMRGVTTQPATYLMAGPSAGAPVLEVVGDGHRVEVIGKKDVWLKIKWDEEIAYVKENAIRPIKI